MKKLGIIILLLICCCSSLISAQDIKVHNFLGKSLKDAVIYYGKPVHQDKSIPEMISTFFQLPNKSYIFISEGDSIYQTQAVITYTSNNETRNSLDKFIVELIQNDFVSDTLSTEKFILSKSGSSIEAEIFPLSNGKFQLKIVARKTEN